VGQVKYRAVVLIAGQAFEGAPDFRMKLQTLETLAFNGFGTPTRLDRPSGDSSPDPLPSGAPAEGGVSSPPAVTAGTIMREIPATPTGDKLTIKALCTHFGVSRRCLMRVFKDHEHCSPGAWVRGVRLEAARMMRSEGRSFKVIANRLGYSSRSSVWRLVKRTPLSPPSQNPLV
jgi:AraC-like DNA-binding protein